MVEHIPSEHDIQRPRRKYHSEGWVNFALIMTMLLGIANAIIGGLALGKDQASTVGPVLVDLQQWGWMLLIFGLLQVGAAILLFARKNYGRIFAMLITALAVVGWLLRLGEFPLGAVAGVVLGVLVIYGLWVTGDYFE